jgi:eukaryotic-like serine/threonine-protein kinase
MQFWNELEGKVIDGYTLRCLARSEGRTAWFDTVGGDGQPATISVTESLTDADEVAERLEAAQQLKHPNLMAISKVGRWRLGQTLLVYALMEHADQDLSEVLGNHALPKEEVRQLAEAMVGGLTAIHQRGLVHGRVEPSSIVAVGETVKLRSDCLQSPGGTRAGDVAGIGATLFQACTQHKASSADDAQINRIPAPFAEIVRNALSARWGLTQIASVLKPATAPNSPAAYPATAPGSSVPPPASEAAAPARVRPPGAPPAERPSTQAPPPAASPAATAPARTADIGKRDTVDEDWDSPRRHPVALYATVAIAVLLLLAWLYFRPKAHPTAPTAPAVASPSAVPSTVTPTAPPAAPVRPAAQPAPRRRPTPARAVPLGPEAANQSEASGPAARPVWRVVAYTYDHQDQAQHKVDEINQAHPELAASVFPADNTGGHYLVTLGGPMDRNQAFKLRALALSAGMPQDIYAQNFAH